MEVVEKWQCGLHTAAQAAVSVRGKKSDVDSGAITKQIARPERECEEC